MYSNRFSPSIGIVVIATALSLGDVMAQQPSSAAMPTRQETPGSNHDIPRMWLVAAGALFLGIYAWGQFNVPERDPTASPDEPFELPTHNRCSTTALRYHAAAACYCLWGLALYALLTTWPLLWNELRRLHDALDFGAIPSGLAEQVTSPLFVALALTILLPKFPVLNALDRWLRVKLCSIARIPYEARQLSKEIQKSDDPRIESHRFAVPAASQAVVREQLQRQGLAPEDIVFASCDPTVLAFLWTKATFLLDHVAGWEIDRGRFGKFFALHTKEFTKLKRQYLTLAGRVKEFLRFQRDNPASTAAGGLLSAYSSDLEVDTYDLLRGLYNYISQAVLKCEATRGRISAYLEKSLGFFIAWAPLQLTIHELIAIGMVTCIVMLGGFLLLVVPQGRMSPAKAGSLAVFIGLTCMIAVVMAILPKDKQWKVAQREGPRPPVAYYFSAGVLAVLVQMPVSFGRRLMTERLHLSQAWDTFTHDDLQGWIWLSFAISFTTAALIERDVFAQPGRAAWLRRYRRYGEGMVQALVMAGMGSVIWRLLSDAKHTLPLGGVVILLSVLGFALGFCVPTWYREAPRIRARGAAARGESSSVGITQRTCEEVSLQC